MNLTEYTEAILKIIEDGRGYMALIDITHLLEQKAKHVENSTSQTLKQEPRKDEVILTKEEYGELVSSEFDNGYAKGYKEALEQGSILDKIRAEIEALEYLNIEDGSNGYDKYTEQYEVLKIIDKYKEESEE